MRRTVFVFGLIAGVFMVALQWIIYTLCLRGYITFDNSTYVGYAGMLIVFSMVFFGIKSYRDNHCKGSVTFWKGVQLGILITLVAAVLHAVGGLIYNAVNPDFQEFFLQKFTEYKTSSLANPADPEAVAAVKQEAEMVRMIYENPILDFLFSTMLILPPGIIVTLISAALLRKTDLLPPVQYES